MVCRSIKILFCIALACLWQGCSKDQDPETRSFYMGFTPFPYEVSTEAVDYVYGKLQTEADIVNHHFDNGVPWAEALTGAPFNQAIVDDWQYRKSKIATDHKVYVSVTPLNFSRNGLAAYRGASDNMALAAPWTNYPLNHADVKTAYLNYCKRIIDFFQPHYFNMAIEANLFYVNNPTHWTEYLQLHTYIYQQLKSTYPNLSIFASVAGAHLLDGFFEGNDYVQQRLAVMQLMEYSDLYAVSFYPYLSSYLGNAYPENTFETLFTISGKPLAIAETGYAAQPLLLDIGAGPVSIASDPLKQQQYMQQLLEACEKYKATFVINFAIRDYDQLWAQIGSPTDLNIAWRDTGFYDENGNARPALSTWKQFLSRIHQPATN